MAITYEYHIEIRNITRYASQHYPIVKTYCMKCGNTFNHFMDDHVDVVKVEVNEKEEYNKQRKMVVTLHCCCMDCATELANLYRKMEDDKNDRFTKN